MRTNRWVHLVLIAVAVCLVSSSAMAAVQIHISVGQKKMDDDASLDGESVELGTDTHTAFGIGSSFGKSTWPILIAVDLIATSDDNTETDDAYGYEYRYNIDVDTTELNLGVRKFWGQKLRGYVGGGFSFIMLDGKVTADCDSTPTRGSFCDAFFPVDILDDNDTTTGFWLQGGIGYQFGKRLSINFDLTYTDAKAKLELEDAILTRGIPTRGSPSTSDEVELEAGGTRWAIMLGIHF